MVVTNRQRRTGGRAFTLIELLVVIGIIALLIGILVPVLAMARKSGQQVGCGANVHQIGLALDLFANDHRDRYPMAGKTIAWGAVDDPPPLGSGLPSWMEQLTYYMDAAEASFNGCPNYPQDSPYHYFLGARAAYIDAGQNRAAIFRPRIKLTSKLVLGGDNTYPFPELNADKDDYQHDCLFEPNNWEPHHAKGLNILYADLHVAYQRTYDPDAMTFRYDSLSPY